MQPLENYIEQPDAAAAGRRRALVHPRTASASTCATASSHGFKPRAVNRFLRSLPPEHQLTLLTDLVEQWGALGADRRCSTCCKKVTAAVTRRVARPMPPSARRSTRIAARPAHGHGAVAASGRARGRGARRRSTSACRPWACSRRAGWSPIRRSSARLKDNELVFVLAHELLHLALRTHDRARGSGPARVQLRARLHHQRHPARRARLHGDSRRRARHAGRAREVGRGDRARDAPQRRPHAVAARRCGRARRVAASGCSARGRPGGRRNGDDDAGDVLGDKREREMFPDDAAEQAERAERDRGARRARRWRSPRRWAR